TAQRNDAFQESRHHPALNYSATAPTDVVARLNARLASGEVTLDYTPGPRGYLPAVLEALGVSPTSQGLVYSQTSFQASHISPANPRAIYFGDDVSVAFIRGAPLIELAAQDPALGTVFYQLSQTESPTPRFNRSETCLSCHLSWDTRAVPGPFVLTTFPRKSDRDYANGGMVDHREPLDRRWGGWYVTGDRVPPRHVGNVPPVGPHAASPEQMAPPPVLKTLAGAGRVRDEGDYLTPYSDVVALLVLEHQLHAMNLMTRAAWEYRLVAWGLAGGGGAAATHVLTPREADAVDELADYLLFVDEVPLGVVKGSSGFAEDFARRGPADAAGRSLRQLQLDGRLMRYPLSYTIYSTAFEALPPPMKRAVYERLWTVLSGRDTSAKYRHLSPADRQAILEILRATRADLPGTFATTAAAR
ncbi:MAG: hypothetical protein AB7U83_14430, partial [Vicinamibacterales bacterium]